MESSFLKKILDQIIHGFLKAIVVCERKADRGPAGSDRIDVSADKLGSID
jgi:hypothetical protein